MAEKDRLRLEKATEEAKAEEERLSLKRAVEDARAEAERIKLLHATEEASRSRKRGLAAKKRFKRPRPNWNGSALKKNRTFRGSTRTT